MISRADFPREEVDDETRAQLGARDGAALEAKLEEVYAGVAGNRLVKIRKAIPAALRKNRRQRSSFEKRLYRHWRHPLDLFEALLIMSQETAESFYQIHQPEAARDDDVVFFVLARLQARACLTASEVLTLLSSGHADGANSRWRTLHELAVVAFFVKERGQDVARRYLAHQDVQQAKLAEQYERYWQRLQVEPLDPQTLAEVRARRDKAIQDYGRAFRTEYGWAADALGIEKPNFEQIEAAVQLDHHRPYYRRASASIHPNVSGLFSNLAADPTKTMLSGPSNAGLADPGQGAIIALNQCTIMLFNTRMGGDQMITLLAMKELVDEACEAFMQAQRDWERLAAELQARDPEERARHAPS
jgi:hypothetical protein